MTTDGNNSTDNRITFESEGYLCLIGLNRVDKRNAFDSHMIGQLSAALTRYENDDSLRCALIFAHGEHFTAGLDLMELQDKWDKGAFEFSDDEIDPWGISGKRRTKPVVVAVQGTCFTAGIELMLNSDVVIASSTCNFAQMEVQRGIMPFGGATVRFVAAAGWQKAMPYLLTGKPFDAQTADKLNLVSEVVPSGTEYDRALTLAQQISTAAPLGVQGLLSSAQDASRHGAASALANIHSYLPDLFHSDDAKEGAMAMVERREAHFTGR
ncbi:crotonase/enoyl-CoA hydratase family protein [Psychrobacter sp. F1192]|uniref:Crotonase/enoyl-CoA hydratase family protein n=1 Tax=Psychrobacter coccoides TaxID=2818440 RepID=A0ABS3NPI1_9GAMM|nr:crotonase/enoyl-CoA hydratase family protein [Psychrobacter coccoides]MBO1530998.1 crotonase/enoyl-CoA hydratase family protein [Psychrobacter coccoides]